MKTAEQWISDLSLEAHPEGGFYSRLYESEKKIATENGNRASATAIHYLLEQGDFSGWHKIKHDELWFFHTGEPLTVHQIDATGKLISTTLSNNHNVSLTVKGNTWFSSELSATNKASTTVKQYSLVSCVVSPGFDFLDFEMGNKEFLTSLYPMHRDVICRLCRE